MLRFLFALAAVVLALVWAWPLTRRLFLTETEWRTPGLLAALALSLGLLSLWMLGLGLLPGRWLTLWTALVAPVVGVAVGLWNSKRRMAEGERRIERPYVRNPRLAVRDLAFAVFPDRRRAETWAAAAIFISLSVIVVNLVYYPFHVADTLSRYALFARRIFEAGRITGDVQGYPLLISLGYTYAFLAAGAVNDYLAGLVSAALAVGLVVVTGSLASRLYGRQAGWAAAFLAATSPLFVIWATSGYVDVPAGFFFGACALFAWLWLERGEVRFALLAGAMAGLAIWTKQSGLTLLVSLAGVTVLRSLWRPDLAHGAPARVRHPALGFTFMLTPVLLIAGPWYLRNYLLSGPGGVVPLPGTWYAAQADHGVASLFPFVMQAGRWGWPLALLGGGGLLFAVGEAVWSRAGRWRALFALAFIVPYQLAWWWSFSYELRFLLTLLPFYAALAGRLCALSVARVRLPVPWPAVAGVVAAITIIGVWPRLGAVYHVLTEPFAGEDSKRARLQPDLWYTVNYLRAHARPGQDEIQLMDGSYDYFLSDYRTRIGYPVSLDELEGFDYFVVPAWGPDMYASLGHAESEVLASLSDRARFQEVFRSPAPDGSVVYRLVAGR